MFCFNTNITSLVIPASVDTIYGQNPDPKNTDFEGTCIGCEKLEKVTFLSKKLKWIPHSMFEDCISLKEVTLPENIEWTGFKAFYSVRN